MGRIPPEGGGGGGVDYERRAPFCCFFGDMSGMKSTQLCGDDNKPLYMGVSKNSGTPQNGWFINVYHGKPYKNG